jgi:uncharacterized protein YqjF (DUF2071 family)
MLLVESMKAAILNRTHAQESAEADAKNSSSLQSESMRARARMLSCKRDPVLFADWGDTLFLHYTLAPELIRPHIAEPFELELYEDQACVSVVAVTMKRFVPVRVFSSAWLFRLVRCQKFLNVRTCVRFRNEPAALFLLGWLSNPIRVRLPLENLLPCAFAHLEYDHPFESGNICGSAKTMNAPDGSFDYRASLAPTLDFKPCPSGSLEEFAMERYTGLFSRGKHGKLFRVWHPPWLQQPIQATVENSSLIAKKFSWFEKAQLTAANFATGFKKVWLGHSRPASAKASPLNSVLSSFYELP